MHGPMKASSDFRVPDTEDAYPLFITGPFSAMWVSVRTHGARSLARLAGASRVPPGGFLPATCNGPTYCSCAYPHDWSIRAYGCRSRVIWVSGWCDLGTVPGKPNTRRGPNSRSFIVYDDIGTRMPFWCENRGFIFLGCAWVEQQFGPMLLRGRQGTEYAVKSRRLDTLST